MDYRNMQKLFMLTIDKMGKMGRSKMTKKLQNRNSKLSIKLSIGKQWTTERLTIQTRGHLSQ